MNKTKYKQEVVAYFSPFLFFTFLVQYAGYYYSFFLQKSNDWIFNVYGIIEYVFYIYFFYKIYKIEQVRKLYRKIASIFLLLIVINIFFVQGPFFLNTYSDIAGCIFIIFSCGLYFREILKSEEYINVWRETPYWITFALFIYYVGQFVLIVIFPLMFEENPSISLTIYWALMLPLNFLLYSLITIGFYAGRKSL